MRRKTLASWRQTRAGRVYHIEEAKDLLASMWIALFNSVPRILEEAAGCENCRVLVIEERFRLHTHVCAAGQFWVAEATDCRLPLPPGVMKFRNSTIWPNFYAASTWLLSIASGDRLGRILEEQS